MQLEGHTTAASDVLQVLVESELHKDKVFVGVSNLMTWSGTVSSKPHKKKVAEGEEGEGEAEEEEALEDGEDAENPDRKEPLEVPPPPGPPYPPQAKCAAGNSHRTLTLIHPPPDFRRPPSRSVEPSWSRTGRGGSLVGPSSTT